MLARIFDRQASDVLAVELLQKDARLSVSGELGRPCPGGTYDDKNTQHPPHKHTRSCTHTHTQHFDTQIYI